MKKRKLCFLLVSHYSGVFGGAQYQAKILLDELVRRNEFEITYLTRNFLPDYRPEGYRIVRIPSNVISRRLGFFADYRAIMRALDEIAPDVIYQRGLTSYTGYSAAYARKNSANMVLHIASDLDVTPYMELRKMENYSVPLIEKKIGEYGLRWADNIITQTYRQRDLLKSNYGRDVSATIRNFHPLPTEAIEKCEPIKVLWIANFKKVKRPEYFVRLAEELRDLKNTTFIMVGRAGNMGQYSQLHEKIANIDNLEYLGEKEHSEVNRLISESHILVNTSLIEGFSNTFIQAWMRRVPVVTSGVDVDGILGKGDIGFRGNNFQEMKEFVLRLIQDSALRERMGKQAQDYAFREHSTSNIDKLVSIIEGSA